MEFNVPLAPAEQSDAIQRELNQFHPIIEIRGLAVYALQADDVPIVMNEIGRVREDIFRSAGAGRNVERDIDALDFGENSYQQLLVWDPKRQEIVALYRFKLGNEALSELGALRTTQLFNYSEAFRVDILPYAIELGRSVVNPKAGAARFGFFALWAGLNALLNTHARIQYFFGNVSLYKSLGEPALTTIIAFCQQLYTPPTSMLKSKPGLKFVGKRPIPDFAHIAGHAPRERIRYLQQLLRDVGVSIPKILQSYLSLGNHIWFDEAARDNDFGDAFELSIIVPIEAIDPQLRRKLTTQS